MLNFLPYLYVYMRVNEGFEVMDPGLWLHAYPSLLMEELRDMVLGDVS